MNKQGFFIKELRGEGLRLTEHHLNSRGRPPFQPLLNSHSKSDQVPQSWALCLPLSARWVDALRRSMEQGPQFLTPSGMSQHPGTQETGNHSIQRRIFCFPFWSVEGKHRPWTTGFGLCSTFFWQLASGVPGTPVEKQGAV